MGVEVYLHSSLTVALEVGGQTHAPVASPSGKDHLPPPVPIEEEVGFLVYVGEL